MLDVAGPSVLGEIEIRENADRIDRLADSLTVRVLRELGRTRAIGVVRSASLGSRSLPALKAFLQGEQFLRRSDWDSALAYHQRAIGLDSGFALAWSHAGLAAGWQHAAQALANTYKLRAGTLNHGLAPRESLVVQAESLAAVVYDGPQRLAGQWWTYGRRLVATLDEGVQHYPDDPELWYMLGDARYHAGALAGLGPRTALDAFDRAIALDSTFTPSYVHAVGLAIELDGPASGRRYGHAFLAAGATGRHAQSTASIIALLDPKSREAALASVADGDLDLVESVWESISRWTDSAETALSLLRERAARARPEDSAGALVRLALPATLAARGHVREAYQRAGSVPFILAQLILLDVVPRDSIAGIVSRWIAGRGEGMVFAAPVLAARRDTTGLVALVRTMDAARQRPLPPTAPPFARDIMGYLAAANRAYLALARGDSAGALRLFDALPDSACYGACRVNDLVHARLLAGQGRAADAAGLLARPQVGFRTFLPIDVLFALERGRINERLGNRERAIEGYSLVVRAWRNPDPELQPYVAEARAALARLTGEKRSS